MIVTTIAQRVGQISASVETNLRCNEFLAIARALAATRTPQEAERFLRSRPVNDRVLTAFEERAAVLPATTTDSTWAAPLSPYTLASDAFAASLRNASAFDHILADNAFLRLPPMRQISITTAGASAATVLEVNTKPATSMSFTSAQLTMSKISSFVIVSAELMKMAGAGPIALLGRELRGAIGQQTDSYFLTQITSGLVAIPSPGVPSATSVRADLRALLDSVSYGANAKLYYIAGPQLAKRLSVIGDSAGAKAFDGVTPLGGELDGVPILISDAAAASTLYLLDASQIAIAAGEIELDRSDMATLQLDSTPDSPPVVGTNYQSLWAQNMSALRAERFLSVQRLRTTAVASVSGITGIGNSPS
jgi:Phage capsid family